MLTAEALNVVNMELNLGESILISDVISTSGFYRRYVTFRIKDRLYYISTNDAKNSTNIINEEYNKLISKND